jgi:hypothetical protein
MESFNQTNPVKNIVDFQDNVALTKQKVKELNDKIQTIVPLFISLLQSYESIKHKLENTQEILDNINQILDDISEIIIDILDDEAIKNVILQYIFFIISYLEYQVILNKMILDKIQKLWILPKYYQYIIDFNQFLLTNAQKFYDIIKNASAENQQELKEFLKIGNIFENNTIIPIIKHHVQNILPENYDQILNLIAKNIDIDKYGNKMIDMSKELTNKLEELKAKKQSLKNINEKGLNIQDLAILTKETSVMSGGGFGGMPYDYIQSPVDNKWISVYSDEGLQILDYYLYLQNS